MLRLVSWNVRYFAHATRGITSLDGTLRRIAAALADMDPQPDVIALQEIDDVSVRSVVGRARGRKKRGEHVSNFDRFVDQLNNRSLDRGGHHYQAQFYPAQGHTRAYPLYSTGLAILHRSTLARLDHNGHEPLDITHRRIARLAKMKQKRICAWSRFRTEQNEIFDVFNTHLSLPAFLQRTTGGRFGESDNQLSEIDSVLACVDDCGHANNALLVGDFNAIPGSRVYNRVLETSSMRDAHATWLGAEPPQMMKMPSAGFMNLRYRLDHIFSGPQVEFHDFHATSPYGKAHPWQALSDHAPLVGRFTLRSTD
ncbi:MAG: endonuclease/exonuclease/phosphatase family metal-dependent hydrolase [Myxococcota bacterium]|jgi:endonuclease/exonuclease/phosphatase family metal-dependent hydrolase